MRLRDQMPELEGATKWFNGNAIKKKDLLGNKLTLIHFWSVSCELCKDAMPNVNKIRDEYEDDLNVIAVHMPRSEKDLGLEHIKRVAKKHDMTQPIFVDNEDKLTNAFSNRYVPAYYLFDKKGKLKHYQGGNVGLKMLLKRINRVLGMKGR